MRTIAQLPFVFAVAWGCRTGGLYATPQPVPRPVARLRAAIDSMVLQPEFSNANWGILIVDPTSGDTLYSRNAGKLFMPASNMKIITGSAALTQLGPDYQYRTTFAARGTPGDTSGDGSTTGVDQSWSLPTVLCVIRTLRPAGHVDLVTQFPGEFA